MEALSADSVWEVLRWLDGPADWRWLALLLAWRYDLRRPLPQMTADELLALGQAAFASTKRVISGEGRVVPAMCLPRDHAPLGRRIAIYGPSYGGRERVTAHVLGQLRVENVRVYDMHEHDAARVNAALAAPAAEE